MRILPLVSLLLTGCVSSTTTLLEVELTGVVSVENTQGPVEVQIHHAEQGEGELAHPLGEIARFWTSAGSEFTYEFDYPMDEGTGLVLYAWLDRDDDGVLCAPGVDDEEAGLIEVDLFPDHVVEVAFDLAVLCEGPEGLYPF